MWICRRWLVHVVLVGALVMPCRAQERARVSPGVDVALAGWQGLGGVYRDRGTPGGTAMITLRSGHRSRALVVGLGMTRQFAFGHDADCRIAPGGGCLEWYPHVSSIVLVGGGEWVLGPRGPGIRGLAGLGRYAIRPQDQRAQRAWGLPVRLQASSPPLGRVRLILGGRLDLLQPVRGERLRQVGYEAGVRVQ